MSLTETPLIATDNNNATVSNATNSEATDIYMTDANVTDNSVNSFFSHIVTKTHCLQPFEEFIKCWSKAFLVF